MSQSQGVFGELYQYRHFIIRSVKRELASRFNRSRLGAAWMLFHPLAQAAIYAFVLSSIMSMRLPGIDSRFSYAIYLLAGLLGWTLFSDIINRLTNVFTENANIIRKMSFPHLALPVISIGVALCSYALLLVAVLAIYLLLGHHRWSQLLWLIPVTALTVIVAASIGLLVGVLNVFIRDVGQLMTIFIQLLFWFTPIIYQLEMLPMLLQKLIQLNPAYHLIDMYQGILIFSQAPSFKGVMVTCAFALSMGSLALFVYSRAADDIADVV